VVLTRRFESVNHQRERHDEEGLTDQPDPLELEDVLERRREFEEVERVDEMRKPTPPGALSARAIA
jgi:hypothetical protein